jgi:hypothetical protein
MPADKQRNQNLFDYFILSDDYFANFTNYTAMRLLEAVNPFLQFRRVGHGCC